MAKVIMVQGTMSGAGKSLLVAGLCRVFVQDGYRVAPFKSQNMALNSFITADGMEMGRAQVMQAEACKIKPDVNMNPILLKPTNHIGSQVIVNGRSIGNMNARDYFEYKKNLIPDIKEAFEKLSRDNDIIVIEGAGSPAEINLRENDIVNMGMAEMVDAPVILVGDIDRGGVFAQLLGTLMLLSEDEKKRVCGLVINKFRGDASLLDSGIEMLEEKGKTPVCGVIPFMDISLEDEDSQTDRFAKKERRDIDIAVIHFPLISNFTDFDIFETFSEVSLRYVKSPKELEGADLIILPGSKNTIHDLLWLKETGLYETIIELSKEKPIIGICGGYQMLGNEVFDPNEVEAGGFCEGLSLLPIKTVLESEKTTFQINGKLPKIDGIFEGLSEMDFQGYEIHMGKSISVDDEELLVFEKSENSNVYGTYVHGIFDENNIAKTIVEALAKDKNITLSEAVESYHMYKETQYDALADIIREHMDMEQIYGMLRVADIKK